MIHQETKNKFNTSHLDFYLLEENEQFVDKLIDEVERGYDSNYSKSISSLKVEETKKTKNSKYLERIKEIVSNK